MKELMAIRNELKVNKNQYNDFGKYKYRSCEDVLEALKPLLLKYDCLLTLNDALMNIGDRYYIQATAEIKKGETSIVATGFAREELTKKGMDASQITGTASSYARKYALNALFLIDDSKDADTNEYKREVENTPVQPVQSETINKSEMARLRELFRDLGREEKDFLQKQKINKIEDLPKAKYGELVFKLEKMLKVED